MKFTCNQVSIGLAGKRNAIIHKEELKYWIKQGGQICGNTKCKKKFLPKYKESIKRYINRKTCCVACSIKYLNQQNALKKLAIESPVSGFNVKQWGGGVTTMRKVYNRSTEY